MWFTAPVRLSRSSIRTRPAAHPFDWSCNDRSAASSRDVAVALIAAVSASVRRNIVPPQMADDIVGKRARKARWRLGAAHDDQVDARRNFLALPWRSRACNARPVGDFLIVVEDQTRTVSAFC